MSWLPQLKPPPDVCPKEYCFFWAVAGTRADLSGRVHKNLKAALKACITVFDEPGCACTFGVCTRADPTNGDHDWYEPHEPRLEIAGLPWFYFIPSPAKANADKRDEYIRESRRLWGDPNHKL